MVGGAVDGAGDGVGVLWGGGGVGVSCGGFGDDSDGEGGVGVPIVGSYLEWGGDELVQEFVEGGDRSRGLTRVSIGFGQAVV